jgi:hypothetical protein
MKRNGSIFALMLLAVIAMAPQIVAEQKKVERQYVKTFNIDEFKIMEYYEPIYGGTQFEIFLNEKKIITTPMWRFEYIENDYLDLKGERHFKDVNQDGIKDLVIVLPCGGTAAFDDAIIYSLDSTGREIGRFMGMDKGPFTMCDYNSDGIIEINIMDCAFLYRRIRVPFVWQWHKGEYRVANFRLAKEILKKELNIDLDSFQASNFSDQIQYRVTKYDPNDEATYPVELLDWMLKFIYCGKPKIAREILDSCWPDSIAGKEKFYNDAMDVINHDKYWPQVLESKW